MRKQVIGFKAQSRHTARNDSDNAYLQLTVLNHIIPISLTDLVHSNNN